MYGQESSNNNTFEVGLTYNDSSLKCFNCSKSNHKMFQCSEPCNNNNGHHGRGRNNRRHGKSETCCRCSNKGHEDKNYWDYPSSKCKVPKCWLENHSGEAPSQGEAIY
eukprot:9663532-Ditylum_brightwellii.AAC.1